MTLSRGQLAYAAADAVLCHRLWEKTARELKAKGRDRAYRLQRDCLPAAAAMELRGIALDLDAHAALCDSWAVELADARYEWLCDFLTRERLAEMLPEAATLPVEIHYFPPLRAINVVIKGLLGRGVSETTRSDPQAKGLAEQLRAVWIDVPEALL